MEHIVSTNRNVAARFDKAASMFDQRSNLYAMARRASALASYVKGSSLEVGGGTGAVTVQLPNRARAIHSDIAPAMCRVASGKLGCPSLCVDAEAIPFAGDSVDSILSAEMIYYLARPQRFLSEAHRVLRPGGRLVISTTNPLMAFLDKGRALLRRMGFRRMFFDDGSPEFPALQEVTGELITAGFVVEELRYIVPLPFRWCHWLNLFLERTPLRRFGLFVVFVARKVAPFPP